MPAISFSQSDLKITSTNNLIRAVPDMGIWSFAPEDIVVDLSKDWVREDAQSDESTSISIPFFWKSHEARVSIAREFQLPGDAAARSWRLIIDGLYGYVAIRLNGNHIDARRGERISVQIDLTKEQLMLDSRSNKIELTVDNATFRSGVLPLKGGIYTEQHIGGIVGGVSLVGSPAVWISGLSAQTGYSNETDSVEVAVSLELRSPGVTQLPESSITLNVSLLDMESNPVARFVSHDIKLDPGGVLRDVIPLRIVNPTKWFEAGQTYLYTVEVITAGLGTTHSRRLRTGFRNFDVVSDGFRIDGEELFMRVLNYRSMRTEDDVFVDEEKLEREIQLIKSLGVHALRVKQCSASPQLFDVCDRNGIMVFEELRLFQTPDAILSEPDFIRAATEQFEAMIMRDKGNVSIAAWGIGAEINQPNNSNRVFYQEMVEAARRLDSRPIYASIPFTSEFEAAPLDFVILEIAPYTEVYSTSLPERITGDRPVLVGSIGRAIIPGNLGGYADPTSESGQAEYILSRVREAEASEWCNGVVVNDFSDWMGEVPSISGPLRGSSAMYTTGLVASDLNPRLAYTRLKDYWLTGDVEPLTRGAPPVVRKGVFVGIGLALLFLLVGSIRQNNLFKLNLVRSLASARNFFQDVSDQRYFQNGHTILLAVLIAGGFALVVSTWLHAYRDNYALDWIAGQLMAGSKMTSWFAGLVWEPLRSFLFAWLCFFLFFWLGGLRMLILSYILGRPCTYTQSLNFVTWSYVGCLAVLPLGMISRQFFGNASGWAVAGIVVFIFLWSSVRLLSVLKRYLRQPYYKVVSLWLIGPVLAIVIVSILLEYHLHFSLYWSHYWGTIV